MTYSSDSYNNQKIKAGKKSRETVDFHQLTIFSSVLHRKETKLMKNTNAKEVSENKHITLLFHDISYFYKNTKAEMNDSDQEHIVYMITNGCSEGELCMVDEENPDVEYRGYWEITKPKTNPEPKISNADKIVKDLRAYVKDKTRLFGSFGDGKTREPRAEAIVECLSNVKHILDKY